MERSGADRARRAPLGAAGGRWSSARDDPLHALAGRRARPQLRRLRAALGVVGRPSRRSSGPRSGTTSRSRSPTPYSQVLSRALDARGALVRGRRAQLRRAPLPRQRRRRGRDPARIGAARARPRSPGASCATQVAEVAAGLRRARRRAGRPRRRLPAQHPRGADRLPRHRQHRRHLVELLTRLRRRERRRPLRPDRAQGPLRGRRLQLRRQGASTAATSSPDCRPRCRRSRHTVVLPYLDPDPDLSAAARRDSPGRTLRAEGSGAELDIRAGPLRPPALDPLLLRHDRPAEGDRPGPRRDPARAPEEAAPPRRRAARATASSGSRRPAG